MNISEFANASGVPTELLRCWERRYGMPSPTRSAHGVRQYSREQLFLVKQVKKLVDLGYRPGKVARLDIEELHSLCTNNGEQNLTEHEPELSACIDLVKGQNLYAVRAHLADLLSSAGLAKFLVSFAAPLTNTIGAGRDSGQFTVAQTYVFKEALESVMRSVLSKLRSKTAINAHPRVLLAMMPQDPSALELLLIEALCLASGASCTSSSGWHMKRLIESGLNPEVDMVIVNFSHKASARSAIENITKLHLRLQKKLRVVISDRTPALTGLLCELKCTLTLQDIFKAVDEFSSRSNAVQR